jgi:hypothetical protein
LKLEVELIRRCLDLFIGEEMKASLCLVFPVRIKWIGSILGPPIKLLLPLCNLLHLVYLLPDLVLGVPFLGLAAYHVVFSAELLE